MNGKDILVAYGVDIDAVGGWLGSYGGEDFLSSCHHISHQISPAFLLSQNNHCLLHRRMGSQCCFNLTKLNTETS